MRSHSHHGWATLLNSNCVGVHLERVPLAITAPTRHSQRHSRSRSHVYRSRPLTESNRLLAASPTARESWVHAVNQNAYNCSWPYLVLFSGLEDALGLHHRRTTLRQGCSRHPASHRLNRRGRVPKRHSSSPTCYCQVISTAQRLIRLINRPYALEPY